MKSNPIYAPLVPDLTGRVHLLVAKDRGSTALLRLLQSLPARREVRILVVAEGEDTGIPLRACAPSELRLFANDRDLLADLNSTLASAVMGLRLYVAGPEAFIGQVVQIAMKYSLNHDEMQCEQVGTLARRVYCIHCKRCNEGATTNIVRCAGCQRPLFVRDHYSRRLAAYMGVMVNAEVADEIPALVETFT